MDSQDDILHSAGTTGIHTSQLTSPQITRFLIRPDFSVHYFVTGEDDKAACCIPPDTAMLNWTLL
jgi:hypothetical protein